jgi:hypothetical protein
LTNKKYNQIIQGLQKIVEGTNENPKVQDSSRNFERLIPIQKKIIYGINDFTLEETNKVNLAYDTTKSYFESIRTKTYFNSFDE